MNYFKRISCLVLAGIIGLSSTVAVKESQTTRNLTTCNSNCNKTMQKCKRKAEKQAVSKEIKGIENELHNLNNTIAKIKRIKLLFNVKSMKHISRLNKKEEIVVLEDKVLARKDIMRKRMVSVQNSSNTSLVVEVVVESKTLQTSYNV